MRFLERFDANGDGKVTRSEVPIAIDRFGFGRFDENGDDRLTREEVERAAGERGRF
jgi:Ca2+-binding EF-hand superfamily protein